MSQMPTAGPSLASLRWHAIRRVARQQARDVFLAWSVYIAGAAAIAATAFIVYNAVRFVDESGLNIIVRPFFLPLQAVTTLALLFVTVEATLAVARPREQGSLQVLFFTPIDEVALVGAHLLAGMAVYAAFILALLPALLLLGALTNFVVPPALLWGLVPTVLVAGLAVAFGLFVSAAAPSGRAAVLLLMAAVLLLLAIQGAYAALLNIPPTSKYYDALLFARVVLRQIYGAMLWISPFRMADGMLDAALRGDVFVLLRHVGTALASTALWLGAAIWALRRRGVLP